MKLYGLLERLTKLKLFNSQEVSVEPNAQTGSAKTITIPDMSPASQAVVLADQAQTLKNKTLETAVVTNPSGGVPLTITNTGVGNSFVVNDEAGDTSAFIIDGDGKVTASNTIELKGPAQTGPTNGINLSSDNSPNALVLVGQNANRATISTALLGASNTYSLPNNSGTIVTTGDTDSVTSAMIADGTIVDGDINAAAAIAGTKVSPNFGTQNVTTTGSVTGSSLTATTGGVVVPTSQGLESATAGAALNVGTSANTSTINIGTGAGVQTVNVGTGSGTTTINIGASTDTVNITGNLTVAGTTTTVNSTTLEVADKNVVLNKGGLTATADGAGLTVEGDAAAAIATIQYDSALSSKFKLGAAGSEAEVVTVSGTQTLSNKTVGTVTAESGTLSITGTGALKIPTGTTVQQPAGVQGMIRFDTTANAFQGYDGTTWSSIGGGGATERVTQTGLGILATNPIGTPLYVDATSGWVKAKADAANTAEIAGILGKRIDDNTVEITLAGEVAGLTAALFENPASLPAKGEVVFLSPTTAGKLTVTEPSVVGQISKPVGIVHNVTVGTSVDVMFYNMRGTVVGAANARTTISVANNAATSVVDVTNYNSLKLEGELFVSRVSGNQRAYYTVEAAKNGAGTWQVSASYTGDDILYTTLPSWDVSGTQLQLTMPNVTGTFLSASLTYSLNAPAVGATLPLSVDSTALNIVDSAPLSYRNFIINGDMRIAQRGTSTTSATSAYVYSLDRWRFYGQNITGSATVSQQGFTAGQTDVPGEPEFFLRWNQTATPGGVVGMTQPVEGVRTLAGQTATLSFWAKAGSARSITARLSQNFGTGGSSAVTVLSSALSLTTVWQKFTVTFSVPSISGKTIGANNYLDVQFIDSNVSTFTIDIAQVQLEVGSKASAFERRPIGMELQLCERYCEKQSFFGNQGEPFATWGSFMSTTSSRHNWQFRTPKRAAPVASGFKASSLWRVWDGNTAAPSTTTAPSFNTGTIHQITFDVNNLAGGIATAFRPCYLIPSQTISEHYILVETEL
jgi:hypothetical protein